jgi:hypothetical protein
VANAVSHSLDVERRKAKKLGRESGIPYRYNMTLVAAATPAAQTSKHYCFKMNFLNSSSRWRRLLLCMFLVVILARELWGSFPYSNGEVFVDAVPNTGLRYCIAGKDDGLNNVNNVQTTKTKKRLELLHIPKTGGSSLEILAAKHNVMWGACHWKTSVNNHRPGDASYPCPGIKPVPKDPIGNPKEFLVHPDTATSNWHVPIVPYFNASSNISNPYANASVFVVVRDPFSRVVSEVTFRNIAVGLPGAANSTVLNQAITKQVESAKLNPHFHHSHWIPQHQFLRSYSDNGQVFVLRFESLTEDFNCLMKKHGLEMRLTPRPPRTTESSSSSSGELTRANLTNVTKDLIRSFFAEDFKILGYATDF